MANLITSYANLETAIQDWTARNDITDSNYLPEIIKAGEDRIYQGYTDNKGNYWPGLRIRQMEKAFTTPTIAADGTYPVPADYLELKYMILTDSGGYTTRLERKPGEWIYKFYPDRSGSGLPNYVGRDGNSSFIFGPSPDSRYSISGIYYYRDTPLSGSYTTNWIVNSNAISFGNLLLAACLAEAGPFLKDPDFAGYWEQRFNQLMRTIQTGDNVERQSGSPLSMMPG